MRKQQLKPTTILYTILTLSILLAASSLIYAIYTNDQLTEQTNQIEYTASLTDTRIKQLESDIEDLTLQAESSILETETKVETESTDDTTINTKPAEQKESQLVQETPVTTTKPAATETKPKESIKPATSNIITESYTITSIDTLDDGSKGYEATSNEAPDGSMSFTGDSVENSSQFKVGDTVIAEFDNDGGLNRIYK